MKLRTLLVVLGLAFVTPFASMPGHASAQELTDAGRVRIARRLARSTVSVLAGPSTGSGFVVGTERWIVTNLHVVEGAVSSTASASGHHGTVQVRFGSGTTLRAEILETDRDHDLALLEVIGGHVPSPPLDLSDSDDVQVGQQVLAFGSPFGLDGTLTEGIVSARRDVPHVGGIARRLIQTDAPINPGNSGGPLVDGQGHVIGVNTAIYSPGPTAGSVGVGFAVPSNYVRDFVAHVRDERATGHVATTTTTTATPPQGGGVVAVDASPSHGLLGVVGEDFSRGAVHGVRITSVVRGSAAQRAGIVGADEPAPAAVSRLHVGWTGHVITAVDGQPVHTLAELDAALATREPGQPIRLSVQLATPGPGAAGGDTTATLDTPH